MALIVVHRPFLAFGKFGSLVLEKTVACFESYWESAADRMFRKCSYPLSRATNYLFTLASLVMKIVSEHVSSSSSSSFFSLIMRCIRFAEEKRERERNAMTWHTEWQREQAESNAREFQLHSSWNRSDSHVVLENTIVCDHPSTSEKTPRHVEH